jgi:hypothetical protein
MQVLSAVCSRGYVATIDDTPAINRSNRCDHFRGGGATIRVLHDQGARD